MCPVRPLATRALVYTVTFGDNTVQADEGHVPRRLRPLIAVLHGLISSRGGPP